MLAWREEASRKSHAPLPWLHHFVTRRARRSQRGI